MELETATTSGSTTTIPHKHNISNHLPCESVIFLEDSDEDTPPDDSDAICLTRLELNIITQRRDQFLKTETKTVDLYQVLIEAEIESLHCILQRHQALGDTAIHALPYVISAKELIHALCLDLISNDPSHVEYWNLYANFCMDYTVDLQEARDLVFQTLLEAETPPSPDVYVQMCYTEHNISADYAKARSYLTQGLQKHKDAVELYLTRLQLEVCECFTLREDFSNDRVLTDVEKSIVLGDHINETYDQLKTNVNLTEVNNVEKIDTFLRQTCEEFPCYPVRQLRQKLCAEWKQTCPSRVELVDLEAKLHLDAATPVNAKEKLLAMFQTYWKTFLADKNGKVLHRALDTFSSLDLTSSTVRRFIYLLLDIGLYYRCLEPHHLGIYFTQLGLENTTIAEMKTKLVFRNLSSDIRLNACVSTWHVKLATFLDLYGTDGTRLAKLMTMASTSLPSPDDLLVVFCRALTRTLPKSDEGTLRFVKAVFSLLHAHVVSCARAQEKLRRILITWLIGRGRGSTAKYQYTRLREGKGWAEGEESGHTALLGQLLLYNPVKRDPEAK